MKTELLVKQVARQKGYTLKTIAERLKKKPDSLTRQLRANPSVGYLEKIADVIGCSVGVFFSKNETSTIKCPHCGEEITIKIE